MVLQNKNLWIGVLIIGLCLREVTPCWYDSTSPYADLWSLNKDVCGTYYDNGKIVGGDQGLVINWPWVGYLEQDGIFRCTVELVTWNWATTAAHCVDGLTASQLKVTFGRSNQQSTYGQEKNVNKIIMHPDFNEHSLFASYKHNDIALLRLDSFVYYNRDVRPVCLPHSNYDGLYDNCYVAGWGDVGGNGEQPRPTYVLQELKVELQTNTECQALLNGVSPISDEHICANNPVFGGICEGDYGGPLMCQIEQGFLSPSYPQRAWSLVGIASKFGTPGLGTGDDSLTPGTDCQRQQMDPDSFDVFTRASKFNQWITDSVDANGGP